MHRRNKWPLPLLCAALLCLSGCTPSDRFSAGESLNREELASISEAIFGSDSESGVPQESDASTSSESGSESGSAAEPPPDGTAYWLDGGSVYHLYSDCYHIRKSEAVDSGTAEDAYRKAGIEKACGTCLARAEKATETSPANETP